MGGEQIKAQAEEGADTRPSLGTHQNLREGRAKRFLSNPDTKQMSVSASVSASVSVNESESVA